MADSRHEAVWDWLQTCPYIADLFFNFSQSENGDTVLVPLMAYSDTPKSEFVDGSSERWYDFSLVRFEAQSVEPNDEQNIEVLVDVEAIAAWIETQAAAGNYPLFPAGSTIQSFEALPSNIGYVAARDNTGAKYMLQFRIEYIKEV
jgi:hypothetical protein